MSKINSKGLDTAKHPCFNKEAAKTYGRVHLPVAPACNVQCNFCNRDYDCVNESRPGVTSSILSPGQASWFFDEISKEIPISVAGIAGPGDPFANSEQTINTMRLIRREHPDAILCVSTNGLNVLPSINDLAEIGVSHVTITVNAIKAEIGALIYDWIKVGKRIFRGIEGATLLLENQLAAIASLKDHGITVKVNSIVIPGINDHHIVDIAKEMTKRGVDIFNCIPMIPVEGATFGSLEEPDHDMMFDIKNRAGKYLPQMKHCQRCRADAVGKLTDKDSSKWAGLMQHASKMSIFPNENRPYIAVASREGYLINQHLGEASSLAVYEQVDGKVLLKERRITTKPGGGQSRWESLADGFTDCKAIILNGIGERPKRVLESKGIKVYQIEGLLDDAVNKAFNGQSLSPMACRSKECGVACSGSGGGCS
ncbi:radical SAM protein [Thiospirochaeta perfilievii]|uniref:FeMo cofactor biosynthesis protein NifB n=1 Tax=Thiospirochaeta perfilievii TaxID=252967 RepID=A0A5C1QBX8_9SPIO|nr:radical SAM protein [Thiospirochaeta perfilievii]QEN04590.1 radical SAM protein [Thiospirochaeta perfilievii]